MACKVRSQNEEDRLAAYEKDVYRERGHMITFEDGSEIPGTTFVWNAQIKLLRDGRFDLEEWLRRKRK